MLQKGNARPAGALAGLTRSRRGASVIFARDGAHAIAHIVAIHCPKEAQP
jgi:hypothetical protein